MEGGGGGRLGAVYGSEQFGVQHEVGKGGRNVRSGKFWGQLAVLGGGKVRQSWGQRGVTGQGGGVGG